MLYLYAHAYINAAFSVLIGAVDAGLFCGSNSLTTSLENSTVYCIISGNVRGTYFMHLALYDFHTHLALVKVLISNFRN